jgi:ankyrin repeat protein
VRIYHQSFAEWLINQTPILSINKTRGHQSIAKFLLRGMREKHTDATFGELTELFMHILSGRSLEMQETAMNLFNVTEMREPDTNQSILHYLVIKPAIYLPVLDFFFKTFPTVDVLDSSNKTPAFYAASEGLVRSLQSCINNGADISYFSPGHTVLDPVSIAVRNTGIEEFSLMHVAVAKGYKDVVQLLIQSNISFPDSSKRYPTPLHLAAANGNLEMVKVFYDYGETFDQITLHHAAARNHLAVVRFILSTVGLRDTCITCQPEHFSQVGLKTTLQEIHAFFCETALHAAVSRGLIDVVKILLNFGKESLECKHHSGKTVLMDAVERNNAEIVDLLLEHGPNVTSDCGRKISKDSNNQMCSIYAMYRKDFLYTVYCVNNSCGCGYRAIHISAKYGLWKMAEKLIGGRIEEVIDIEDCEGDSATHVAIIYDNIDFVQNINMSLEKIGQYLVESKMVKLAIKHCSVSVAKRFLNYQANEDEIVWNLLRQSVLWSPCDGLETEKVYNSYCLNAFKDDNRSKTEEIKTESERRLNIIKLLTETHQQKFLVLHKNPPQNWTLLHYAAFSGFNDAVKFLVELGAVILH